MSTVVIYKSKSGYVKKYAEWISDKLNCDILENKELKLRNLEKYDTIICGGGIYASAISGVKIITDNFDLLSNKNLVVFASGISLNKEETLENIWKHNFTAEQMEKIHTFYLRGGFNFSKLGFLNKSMMKMMKKIIEKKEVKDEDSMVVLSAMETPVDFTNEENIKELVDYVRSI